MSHGGDGYRYGFHLFIEMPLFRVTSKSPTVGFRSVGTNRSCSYMTRVDVNESE